MDDDVKLYCGDCLDVLRTLPDASVDAVVTDPPYGTHKTEWDHSVDAHVIAECVRVSRGYSLFCYSNTRLWHILGIVKSLGRDAWVIPWLKTNAMGCERRFAPRWVPVVCVYRDDLPFWGGDTVEAPIVVQKHGHPTPKPVRLMEHLIAKATSKNEIVLDPFMGSGTTGIACIKHGRRFIGVEIDPTYFRIAERRIAQARERAALPLFERHAQPGLFDAG